MSSIKTKVFMVVNLWFISRWGFSEWTRTWFKMFSDMSSFYISHNSSGFGGKHVEILIANNVRICLEDVETNTIDHQNGDVKSHHTKCMWKCIYNFFFEDQCKLVRIIETRTRKSSFCLSMNYCSVWYRLYRI